MKHETIETVRHSLAHILAHAVKELYPNVHPVKSRKAGAAKPQFNGVKFGMGPAIENGFYYDFELPKEFSEKDLPKIEKKMRELIKQNIAFKKKLASKQEGGKIFKNQPYKLELIKELPGGKISIYESGEFIDLCKGPQIKSTLQLHSGQTKEIIDAFKLMRIAGAYWKGDEKNPMLTRIYGIAFNTKKELNEYLKLQAEAEKRDHRILGQKLDLFLFDEEVGSGLPIWMPKGAILRKTIEDYLYRELTSQGYQFLITPHIGNLNLWKKSGHWELYRENMYSPIKIEKDQYELKPMNCPFHVKVYKSQIRSYKDLPIKYAEFGTVYRYERSGTLHGLTRVRGFTQDDAHIWCTPEQLNEELVKLLKHGLSILKTFGFKDFNIYISTRPEKYAGDLKGWEKATNVLKDILGKLKLKYEMDAGGGVFYGPKIDIKIKDTIGREWQCTTIQVDFNLPDRFNIVYIDKRGNKVKPYMIHRALIGSMERFIGVLLEHYEGNLPFWLSPVQAWIIPIGSSHKKYAKEIYEILRSSMLRTEIKDDNETVSKKIREGQIQKVPYLLVVGDKEVKARSVAVRERGKNNIEMIELEEFIEKIKKEIASKK